MKKIKVNFKAEKNVMAIAWEIRTATAIKWNCKRSEIVFSICLRMAWAEKKDNKDMTKIEIAEKANETLKGKIWTKGNNVRIYLAKGYVSVEKTDLSLNIDAVGGHLFMDAKSALKNAGFTTYRR